MARARGRIEPIVIKSNLKGSDKITHHVVTFDLFSQELSVWSFLNDENLTFNDRAWFGLVVGLLATIA